MAAPGFNQCIPAAVVGFTTAAAVIGAAVTAVHYYSLEYCGTGSFGGLLAPVFINFELILCTTYVASSFPALIRNLQLHNLPW